MKVNVMVVEDIVIRRFRWWSNWIDICIYDFDGSSYLVQMRISRTNAKSFRSVKTTGIFSWGCGSSVIGDLTGMTR